MSGYITLYSQSAGKISGKYFITLCSYHVNWKSEQSFQSFDMAAYRFVNKLKK